MMSPNQLRQIIAEKYQGVVFFDIENGFSVWLGKKQLRPFSTRILRVNANGSHTKLKRAGSCVRDGTDEEQIFFGGADEFRKIFELERIIVEKLIKERHSAPHFQVGQVYNRKLDITGRYGGSGQSGIAPSVQSPAIFLFTGDSGHRYGYKDREEAGVFSYCGEGQVGDMKFSRGNAAIRDHAENGRAIHLFRVEKGGHFYLGEFCYSTHELQRGRDRTGNERELIIFHLVRVELVGENSDDESDDLKDIDLTLKDARDRALSACQPKHGSSRSAISSVHQRSMEVKRYVLMRADGQCESCKAPAPFRTLRNKRYLEPHHITRLSDGGLDHPEHVGAICPNCHCEIHHGANGRKKNYALKLFVAEREATLWPDAISSQGDKSPSKPTTNGHDPHCNTSTVGDSRS